MSSDPENLDSCHDLVVKLCRRWIVEFEAPLWPRTKLLLFARSSELLSAHFCSTKVEEETTSSESASADADMDQDHEEDGEAEFSGHTEPDASDSSDASIAAEDILPGWLLIQEFQKAWQTATGVKLDLEISLLLHEQAANTMQMPDDAKPQKMGQTQISTYTIASANGVKIQVRWDKECFRIIAAVGGQKPDNASKINFQWDSYKSIEFSWKAVVAASGWDRPAQQYINNLEHREDQ